MKKCFLFVLIVLGAQLVCAADTWSDLLRAYKMDLNALARGNGYQIFRSEAGGLGIAYSETDAAGQCHFSLAMVPVEASGMRWLPGTGANYLEVRADPYISGVMALQEVKGPETDPKLGSFCYVVEPRIFVGSDGRILNPEKLRGFLGGRGWQAGGYSGSESSLRRCRPDAPCGRYASG